MTSMFASPAVRCMAHEVKWGACMVGQCRGGEQQQILQRLSKGRHTDSNRIELGIA